MMCFAGHGARGIADEQSLHETAVDLGGTSLDELSQNNELADDDTPLIDFGSKFLYDAESFGFDKDVTKGLFKGDVVLIGGASILTSDVIAFDSMKKTLSASGHVIFLSSGQLFFGSNFVLQYETGEFEITDAVMVANDPRRVNEIIADILGMSEEELVFEGAKSNRLKEIEKKKIDIRRTIIQNASSDDEITDQQIDLYARLLEQQSLIKNYESPILAAKGEQVRNRMRKRRRYWRESRQEGQVPVLKKDYYLRLTGSTLEKVNENDFRAYNATWTPCLCEEDENPAWSFRADEIRAQRGGYIDLSHPILMVKGIPVLYIPFLKVPFKTERQSGFLMPGFQSGDKKVGFVYSQPLFFDFADNYDMTMTWDLFQNLGTKLGLETRYEAREYSGFEFNFETIRDRSWVLQGAALQELRDYYTNPETSYCADTLGEDATAEEFEACEEKLLNYLRSPENIWRGKQEWEGKYFFTPRLSLATKGTLVSDHRYVEDLYLPEDYTTAFALQNQANAYSTAKARLNYDEPDYFLGLGSSYGDSVVSDERFQGLQIAGKLNMETRMFSLNPKKYFDVPIYGNIELNQYIFQENGTSDDEVRLGPGQWRQVKGSLISPIIREGIVRLDHFSEAELRQIYHPLLADDETSTIQSWRTGFSLNLPIDGMGRFPDFLQRDDEAAVERYLHHIMDWSLTYSIRPSVVRRGAYGSQNENGASLVYFATDREVLVTDGRDVTAEDTMIPHQRITFATSHRWQTFDRSWKLAVGKISDDERVAEAIEDLHAKARRELLYSLDQPITGDKEIFSQNTAGNVDWYINRYQLLDQNHYEPISFSVSTTFDIEREQLRKEKIAENKQLAEQAAQAASPEEAEEIRSQIVNYYDLPESWSGPYFNLNLNWSGYRLSSSATYNIYKRTSTALFYDLTLPSFWKSKIGIRYLYEKSPVPDSETGSLAFKKTKTSYLNLSTGLIPAISTGISLIQREEENEDKQYATSFNLSYTDVSRCWGVRFVREKDLNRGEEDANYLLQLSVLFFGNNRAWDVSPALEREIPRFTFHGQ